MSASAITPTLRRALLYVPASSTRMLQKSRLLAVDTIAYDLEDSVAPSEKSTARENLCRFLATNLQPGKAREVTVRINGPASGLAIDDLNAVVVRDGDLEYIRHPLPSESSGRRSEESSLPNVAAIVIPKVTGPEDLHFVVNALEHRKSHVTQLLALVESAKAIQSLGQICNATPRLTGLIFAAEDFALDLSLTRTPGLSEFLYARSAIVTAAVAAGIPSIIDLVHTSYGSAEALRTLGQESVSGKGLGFNGKQVIHPSQIDTVQSAFSPGEQELIWAVRIHTANEKAVRLGKGAWGLDGKMIDMPVISKARSILDRAELCGIDRSSLMERWKSQEPE